MAETKAPKTKPALDPESESWNMLPWRKLEQHVYRIQKRIFKAKQRGNVRAVHKLQKLLMKSRAARLLAVRRVTQDNRGKKTAGIDGVKSVRPKQRFEMVDQLHPQQRTRRKPQPVRRIYIPKPGKDEKRSLGIPVMLYASKMIMRPERETEEQLDPCPGQTDCRYVAEPLRESEPVPENAAPDQRAAAQTFCADDYASRPVARRARAIQCGWRQDHRPAYTPRISAPGTR